jgi:NitT/TauT family transport system ATP-binding protein
VVRDPQELNAVLVFRDVWMEYGAHVVLENINLAIAEREFVTIVGASGCGKSTLLRILLGEVRPTRGSIEIGGEPLAPEPDRDRGVVFQRYSVFPHLTVIENVLLGREVERSPLLGRTFGRTRARLRRQALETIEAVGLEGAASKYPAQLSGGMQQRLAIAQSIVKRPRMLLLDEPFGALDPGIRADMHALVLQVWRASAMQIFMVTHDIQEGFALGTRLIVLNRLREDEHAPERYGARVTYDIPLNPGRRREALAPAGG